MAITQAEMEEALEYINDKKNRNKKVPVSRPTPMQPDDPEKPAYSFQEFPKVKYAKATKENPAPVVINPLFQRDQPEGPNNLRYLKPAAYVEVSVLNREQEEALKGEWFDTPDLKAKK